MSIGLILAGAVTLALTGALVSLWARQRRAPVSSAPGGEVGYYPSTDTSSAGSWESDSCGDAGSSEGGGDCGGDGGGGGGDGGGD
ncbi:MAG TPA: hypothetical protein VH764_14095 [Gemmatimonadales bacterium]|jgi:hypothetical protein